ncbi:hypothetical protein D3C76_1838560 [compost metagenome]
MNIWIVLSDPLDQFQSIHAWHTDVNDHEMRQHCFVFLYGVYSVGSRITDLETSVFPGN